MSWGFRYKKDGKFYGKMIADREMMYKLLGNPKHVEKIEKIKAGDQSLKNIDNLILCDFCMLYNEDGTVAGSRRVANTDLADFDRKELEAAGITAKQLVDHIIANRRIIEQARILFGEYSVNGNVHVVYERDPNLTHSQNLDKLLEVIGIPGLDVDPKGRNNPWEGCFCTSPKNFWWLDDRIFEIAECPNLEPEEKAATPIAKQTKSESIPSQSTQIEEEELAPTSLNMFDCCCRIAGLDPLAIDKQGYRNPNLQAIMSAGACQLLSEGQFLACVKVRMPSCFDTKHDETNCKELVHYFFSNFQANIGKFVMSKELREINAQAQNGASKQAQGKTVQKKIDDELPPEYPKVEPETIRLLTKQFEPRFKEMIAVAAPSYLAKIVSRARFQVNAMKEVGPNLYVAIAHKSGRGKAQVQLLFKIIRKNTFGPLHYEECRLEEINQEEREELQGKKDRPRLYKAKHQWETRASLSAILKYQKNLGPNEILLLNFEEASEMIALKDGDWSNLERYSIQAWDITDFDQSLLTSVNFHGKVGATMVITGTLSAVIEGLNRNTSDGFTFRTFTYPVQAPLTRQEPEYYPLTDEEQARLDELLVGAFQRNATPNNEVYHIKLPKTEAMIKEWEDKTFDSYEEGELSEAEMGPYTRIKQFMLRCALCLTAIEGSETDEIVNFAKWYGETAYYYSRKLFSKRFESDNEKNEKLLGYVSHPTSTKEDFDAMPDIFTRKQFYEQRRRTKNCQTKEEIKKCDAASKKLLQEKVKACQLIKHKRDVFQKVM